MWRTSKKRNDWRGRVRRRMWRTSKKKNVKRNVEDEISTFHLPTTPLSDEVVYLTRKI